MNYKEWVYILSKLVLRDVEKIMHLKATHLTRGTWAKSLT